MAQGEHGEGTIGFYFNACFPGQFHQFRVFGARVEDNSFGFELEDVVVVFLLDVWVMSRVMVWISSIIGWPVRICVLPISPVFKPRATG